MTNDLISKAKVLELIKNRFDNLKEDTSEKFKGHKDNQYIFARYELFELKSEISRLEEVKE